MPETCPILTLFQMRSNHAQDEDHCDDDDDVGDDSYNYDDDDDLDDKQHCCFLFIFCCRPARS